MRDYSYQLYSSRKFPDLDATLGMLARLGYKQVEGYGALYSDIDDLARFRDLLIKHGLTMPTSHIGLPMIEERPDQVIEIAKTLQMDAVIVPFIAPEDRPSDTEGWKAYGKRIAEALGPLSAQGLRAGYHNHAFELEKLSDGSYPLDHLMSGSQTLLMELDLAWVFVGGGDPIGWLEEYSDRLISVHIKDVAPNGRNEDEDGWADVGHGIMDWSAIFGALEQTKADYFILEHDNPSDHERFARRSIETLRTL